ncbi:MAG: sigma-54 dependent transcriptional regulator, partial [Pseudomonadota bacterium]
KPFDGKELVRRIRAILDAAPTGGSPGRDTRPAPHDTPRASADIWGGEAPAMASFLTLLERVARSTAGVLLLGESGTGKELAARYLHRASPRADGPLVVVDCGSTQPSLLESELFGHVKGSFTHAVRDKRGLIEEADGGTLFLDEIGNISPEMQTRLLRFLQEGTIRRVGDTRERTVSCRVVAATNADLAARVRDGRFREDLYYRLKVITLTIPPLRQRVEDIPLLAKRLVETLCREQGRPAVRLSDQAMDRLTAHPWPGNVRELKHALEAALVFCPEGEIGPDDIQVEPPANEAALNAPLSLEESEKRAVIDALTRHGGVKKDAADALGISRRAIHYKIRKHGIGSGHE